MDKFLEDISRNLTSFLQKDFEDYKDFSAEIKNIKNMYMELVKGLLTGEDLSSLKPKAFLFGRYLFQHDISYMLLLDIDDYIFPFVIERLSNDENLLKEIHKLEDRFRFLENKVAYGYLTENIKQDKNWIREKLRIIKNSESTLKPFVKDHLIWVNKVLEDIRKLRSKSSVPIGHNKCDLGKRLEESEGLGIYDEYRDEIIVLHKKIHGSALQIYHFMKNKDFKHLLLEYLEFFNLIGKFVSLLGLTFAVMYEEDANIDPLTKVLSRRSLEFILSSQFHIAKISKRPLSIAMVDIDDFKRINDQYGHQIGDAVLRKVAGFIQDNLRKSDFIFRYGGEEFLIIFPFTTKKDAVFVMERIVKKLSGLKLKYGDFEGNITISAGIASIDDASDMYTLVSKADKALYRAKKAGKNRVSV
ncbi:MAG TPA: sensor domain-containing diguanylate cyclase [Persephonella sp.]|nr:sensor domain-containing diguanylate cyclase [Persephonella sp.]